MPKAGFGLKVFIYCLCKKYSCLSHFEITDTSCILMRTNPPGLCLFPLNKFLFSQYPQRERCASHTNKHTSILYLPLNWHPPSTVPPEHIWRFQMKWNKRVFQHFPFWCYEAVGVGRIMSPPLSESIHSFWLVYAAFRFQQLCMPLLEGDDVLWKIKVPLINVQKWHLLTTVI